MNRLQAGSYKLAELMSTEGWRWFDYIRRAMPLTDNARQAIALN